MTFIEISGKRNFTQFWKGKLLETVHTISNI